MAWLRILHNHLAVPTTANATTDGAASTRRTSERGRVAHRRTFLTAAGHQAHAALPPYDHRRRRAVDTL